MLPEHLIHSFHMYLLGVYSMLTLGKSGGDTVMNKADTVPALMEPTDGKGSWRMESQTK